VHAFIRSNPYAAAELISRAKGIPAEITARIIAKVRWDAAFYLKDMNALQQLSLPLSKEICFKSEYLQLAIKELKLPQVSCEPLEGDWAMEQLY
ncbi:hypothetical protein AB4Z22_42630, partial [Paenibacillus sp. TAF58]